MRSIFILGLHGAVARQQLDVCAAVPRSQAPDARTGSRGRSSQVRWWIRPQRTHLRIVPRHVRRGREVDHLPLPKLVRNHEQTVPGWRRGCCSVVRSVGSLGAAKPADRTPLVCEPTGTGALPSVCALVAYGACLSHLSRDVIDVGWRDCMALARGCRSSARCSRT